MIRGVALAAAVSVDVEKMRAINLSHYKLRLRDIFREQYLEHGWDMPVGLIDARDRDPLNYSGAEASQAKRVKRDTAELKRLLKSCWTASDSRTTFASSLREQGFCLARGDQRGFVAVDADGEVHYSVPVQYAHLKVDAKLSATTVFVFHQNQQITCHERLFGKGKMSIHKYHRPSSHQFAQETQLSSCIETVSFLGQAAVEFIKSYHRVNRHSPPPHKAAWEIVQLAEEFGVTPLARACRRSNAASSTSLRKLRATTQFQAKSHLKPENIVNENPTPTGNVRGEEYYNKAHKSRGDS